MRRKSRLLGVFALTGTLIWSTTPGAVLGLGTDTTKPESWVQVAPSANENGWHKSDVTLNFFGYDGESGLSNLEYKVDEGLWQTGNQCKVTNEGNNNVYYRAVDRAGNIEIAKSQLIKLDKTLPTVTIPFKLSLNNFAVGIHNLQVIATDRAGNQVTQNSRFGVTTIQDTTAPATIVGLPLANANGWYKEPPKITFSAVDESGGSGVKYIEYRMDNGNWIKGYELLLSLEGRHTLAYRAVDFAGNVENARELIINLDSIKPVIKMNIKNRYLSTETLKVDFSESDSISGVQTMEARLDNVVVSKGQLIPLSNYSLGKHYLKVTATDYAGNQVVQEQVFTINNEDLNKPVKDKGTKLGKKPKKYDDDDDDDSKYKGKEKKKGWGHVKKQGLGHDKHGDD